MATPSKRLRNTAVRHCDS